MSPSGAEAPAEGDTPPGAAAAPSAATIRRARRFRLPHHARPGDVELHLDVDPARRLFGGHVSMKIVQDRGSRTITVHASGLRPSRARVRSGAREMEAEIEVDPLREVLRLRFERTVPRGESTLEVDFEGEIREDLEGLYGVECGGKRFAFSQLCTTRARSLFPCFDEPGFKARYRISVTTPAVNDVVSNMPVSNTRIGADGRKTVDFERTPPLSTYLLALAVGELERSRSVFAGDTEIAVVTTPGKSRLADLALDVAQRALPVLEAWFGIAYPYPKLDLVAVPDFSFGAMENAGAVFFRETLLLADPDHTSFDERKRLTETICHELAHMWFGDLVTMAWWDDLWLNESFATWMAFHVVGEIEPSWRTWQTFQHRKDAALDLDALAHTHPVYVPVASAEEANENFDLITYEKGASVIRMLAGYLGPEAFRDGVRRYIEANLEGNAVAADLWAALESASDQPVAAIMRAWVERAGHPRVRIERTERAGAEVFLLEQSLHQTVPARHRGRASSGADDDGVGLGDVWPVPLILRLGNAGRDDSREIRLLVEGREAALPAAGVAWIHGNANEAGFYRPWLDEREAAALRAALPELSGVERQGLVGHTWALVQAGATPIESLLSLAEACRSERDPDVLQAIAGPIAALSRGLVHDLEPGTAAAWRRWIIETFGDALDRVGTRPSSGESEDERRARAELLGLVGLLGERDALVAEAPAWAARVLDGADQRRTSDGAEADDGVDPELASTWLLLAARFGGDALYERCIDTLHHTPTPQARQRALFAMTEFAQPDLADRTLARCAEGRVSSQDLVFVLGRLLAHPNVQERAWSFIRSNWDALARHLPGYHAPRLIAATPALRSATHRGEVTRFFRDLNLPSTKRALEQAIERFEGHDQLRAHAGESLARWLDR